MDCVSKLVTIVTKEGHVVEDTQRRGLASQPVWCEVIPGWLVGGSVLRRDADTVGDSQAVPFWLHRFQEEDC